MNRACLLAGILLATTACDGGGDATSSPLPVAVPTHPPGPPPIVAEEVAWALETGIFQALTAHPGGDVTIANEQSLHTWPENTVIQRRGPDGAARWYLDFPRLSARALASTPDGGTVLVLLDYDTASAVYPVPVRAAETLALTAEGVIAWRIPEEGVRFPRSLSVAPDGDMVTVWERPDGTGSILRRRAADGALRADRELPAWSQAALDPAGAVRVVEPCAVEAWTLGGDVAWRREVDCNAASLSQIVVLPDGSIVVSGARQGREFAWCDQQVGNVYRFETGPMVVALDTEGTVRWCDAPPVGGRGRGMPAVGVDGAVVWPWCDRPQDGFSFACSVRVDATDQAPAWEREVADWWPSPNALVAGEGTVILTGSLHSFAPKRFGPVKLTGPGDGGYALALRR